MMSSRMIKRSFWAFLLLATMILSLSSLMLTVEAADGAEWKTVIFGQSTSPANNYITLNADNTVTLVAGPRDGSTNGGKIATSNDGISYYYTELSPNLNFELSAKVTVNYFAKATPDNQEAFGIMARDAIGNNYDSNVFSSNMVMVGGYRGLIQSVSRKNVVDTWGNGATIDEVFKFGERPANDGSATYLLKMRKSDDGYYVSVDGSPEKVYYQLNFMQVLNPQIYVGFFAARVASITVSDIRFTTSYPFEYYIKPSLSFKSPSTSSTSSYDLNVTANVNGRLEIRQNGAFIANDPITGMEDFTKNTTLQYGENVFDLTFFPDPNQFITSDAPVYLQHKVIYRTYGAPGGTVYVAPNGQSASLGTKKDPIDIYSAVQFLQAGQTAYITEGAYVLTTPLLIEKGNDGAEGQPKVLMASKKRPVFDFGKVSIGLIVAGSYWEIHGVDITHAASHGCLISGNHNLVEQVNTYANGNTGLQLSGSSTDRPDQWPSYNLVLNCDSYDNLDAAENYADGFAAKITCGEGNVFRGCIAHNNCDDGYDLFAKLETGPIGAVILENCIAYSNGTLSNGYKTQGDGNGFKLGGEGLAIQHKLRNSLAFNNAGTGVTSNSDPAIIVENTTSADNGKANFEFSYYSTALPQFSATKDISFRTIAGLVDSIPASLSSVDNYFYNGTVSVNSISQPVLASYFKSVTPAPFDRDKDGHVSKNHYMELMPNAPITGGFDVRLCSKEPKSNEK